MTKENESGGILKSRKKDTRTGITFEEFGHFTDVKRYFITEVLKSLFADYKRNFKNVDRTIIHKKSARSY